MARAAYQGRARGAASQHLRRLPSAPESPNWRTAWRHQRRTPRPRWEMPILRRPSAKLPRERQGSQGRDGSTRHRELPNHRIR
eukprot:9161588-Pyramimonas_sp.AAC.1